MSSVTLPYDFDTRTYQQDFWDKTIKIYSDKSGVRVELLKDRAFMLLHRRSGKDLNFVNWLQVMAYYHRVGTYWYMFPYLNQAKKIVWDGMDDLGRKFMHYFPKEIIADTNETELQITLTNGSIIQLMGADKFSKSSIGPNPIGVGFSEYAVSAKMELAWNYVMPMLRQNGGWAVFLTTPRGKNHAYKLWNIARQNTDAWYTSLKTVSETLRDSDFDKKNPLFAYNSPVISAEMLDKERRDGMPEEVIQQEYFCSFHAPTIGAYFARNIESLRAQGRITRVPWEPSLPVDTWWDIGHDDHTCIWFVQKLFREIRVIDFYQNRLQEFGHYASKLREGERGMYVYGKHIGPHDLAVKEWFTNKTRLQTAADLGVRFIVSPKTANKQEPIQMVRAILPRCIFDEAKCEYGINALESYHCEYNEETKVLGLHPEHDWSSNPADAFMSGASMDTTSRAIGPRGLDEDRVRQTTGHVAAYNVLARN